MSEEQKPKTRNRTFFGYLPEYKDILKSDEWKQMEDLSNLELRNAKSNIVLRYQK